MRENNTTRTEGIVVRSMCWAVKELESESTIQTTASPSLTQQQHKGSEKSKHICEKKGEEKKIK